MVDVLNLVKEMEREGRWSQLREQGEELLAQAPSTDHARIHAALSTAYFWTAQRASDWGKALDHAHACNRLAEPGGLLYAWTYQKLSSLYVAVGRYDRAAVYGRLYMGRFSNLPALASYTPHVLRDLGHVAFYAGKLRLAAAYYRKAIQGFSACGETERVQRTRANLAWALAAAGDTAGARRELSMGLIPAGHLELGALTLVLYKEGQLVEAIALGRKALSVTRRMPCDYVDAAEVAWIVGLALRKLGQSRDASGLLSAATEFAALQGTNVDALAVLSGRAGGGVLPHVHTASSVGDCGFHPDCCLTTGIA